MAPASSTSLSPDAIFQAPPWRGAGGRYRLGLSPIDAAQWFPRRISPQERERKVALFHDHRDQVLACLDRGTDAAVLAARSVANHLGASDADSLDKASLLVPDDLCVMQRRGEAYELVAASLCSPSYWSLKEKIGQPLWAIHATVDGLNDVIGARMQRFFERLPLLRIFERRNWSMHVDADRFHPRVLPEPPLPAAAQVLRSERQTLRKLSDDVVLFTIDVRFAAVADLAGYPDAAADMRASMRCWSADEREDFGEARYDALLEYLATLLESG